MIKVTNLTKSFNAKSLFENLSFALGAGDRVGLVGRNGSGKSTLFKIILDEEHYDSGEITMPKGYRIGALKQHIHFTKPTVLEECMQVLGPEQQYESYRIEKLLFGLGFEQDDLGKDPRSFSGGYQIRINLVKLLATEPNLLLLDEPTNYLDIVSMRWLRGFLQKFDGEVIIITHDREFMDSVTTHTMGIHRGSCKLIKGDTAKYYKQLEEDEILYEKTRQNQEKKIAELEDFIARNRARASTAALAQSKAKELEKIDRLDRLGDIAELDFEFSYADTPAKIILEANELSFGYTPENILFRKVSFALKKGKKLAIIGKNGKGKSTLLNIIAKELTPLSGEISYHPQTLIAHFGQTNIERLSPNNTILEEIQSAHMKMEYKQTRAIAGAMMFSDTLAEKKVSVLSGGEKSRVMLGKIIATPANLLLLDEPTNHLDMESIESLSKAIEGFEGAVVMVTHSEMLLRRHADELIVFREGSAEHFEGNYEEFLAKIGWDDEPTQSAPSPKKETPSVNKKELKKLRADLVNERSKLLSPLKKEIDHCENRIMECEELIETSNEELLRIASSNDVGELTRLSKAVSDANKEIEELFERLEIAQTEFDSISEEYERKIGELG